MGTRPKCKAAMGVGIPMRIPMGIPKGMGMGVRVHYS